MSKHGVERRTGKVDEMLGEVLVGSDAAVATVAKAICDVNETFAVHAAWTEERFETVDDRLVSLARIQVMASSKVEMQIAGIDSRIRGFEASQSGMRQTLSKLEHNHAVLMQDHAAMCQKVERLELGQEALQQGLAALVETMRGLTVRVGEVLAHAISEELKHHVTRPTD
ncbi:hypothetical protein [Allorhizocola rhizosphaerae]|uniref:hypothetical protein n=1 Tax=Allorhizocola rhizosphaerae TaxID=1872709 RepID=UPI000E3BAE09|nr:hypothetical protein [Allorhizocola rhizosphaerae]